MPLATFTSSPIVLPVSDRVVNDTVIKQTATFTSLTHTQANGSSTATVNVLVEMYGVVDGGYGDKLTGPGFSTYSYALTADNNTVVDAETGDLLIIRTNESDAEWRAKAELDPRPVMFQGDWFEMLREQPAKIGDLIRAHILNADALGRFK